MERLAAYAENGVDIVEFGWPALDPYLDGPEVRASMQRALRGDAADALRRALEYLARISTPPKALLMTYAEQGHPALSDAAFFRGLDGLLPVASPNDALRVALEARARQSGVGVSAFVPLPIDDENVAAARRANFYTMLQSAHGVTGPRATLDEENGERIERLRRAGVAGPILVGFGISDGAQVNRAVALGADGVVVGSTALRAARQGLGALDTLLKGLRNGLDG